MFINCYEFLINDKHVLEIDYEKKIDYNSIEILDYELKDIIKQNNIVKDGII